MSDNNNTHGPILRKPPLPALPCSRRTEPSKWLCPPPGRERMADGYRTNCTNVAQWLVDAAERAQRAAEAEDPNNQVPAQQLPLRLAASRSK